MKKFTFSSKSQHARRTLGIALGRPLLGPQVVSLEVTHHCNLRCSFCESHGSYQALPITATRTYIGGRRTMDLETIRRLAADLARIGTGLVELSGKGDPIAHPQLADIAQIIKQAGLGCAIVTNGTLAKPNLASTLVQNQLDRLSVSLNAGSREAYLRSNGRDLWEKAIQFLTDVLQQRGSTPGTRPWVRVTHVVSKDNVDDIENMVRVPCELKVDEVVWYVMGELPETDHLQIDDEEKESIRRRAPEWKKQYEAAGVTHNLDTFVQELPLRVGRGVPQTNPLQKKLPCYQGWMFCVIQPDGVVLPCCYCEEETLGNIFDNGFEEIWHGALYRHFREQSLEMPKTGRWICKECFTTCNRAEENLRIYNKVHLIRKTREVDGAEAGTPV